MTHYNIIEKDKKRKTGYGVKVIKEKVVEDISNNYTAISTLVNTCNKMNVDFDHFEDILENFAEDFETF